MKVLPIVQPDALEITYLQQVKVRSQIIYTIFLLTVIAVLFALPFVYVDVSVKSSGILQTPIERNELVLPISGRIDYLNVSEYQRVNKGDTLLRIDARSITEQSNAIATRIKELEWLLADVELLNETSTATNQTPKLNTPRYTAAWQEYNRQLHNAAVLRKQSQRAFERFQKLHEQKMVSDAEYEEYLTKKDQAVGEFNYIASHHKSQWQAEASTYRSELSQLYRDRSSANNEQSFYTLIAPLDGSIQNLVGLQVGTPVFANQKIAELTPDSSLIAMAYVNPNDIGLVRIGQDVRFQIDAFNYNQWGILKGKVLDIAEDMVLDGNNKPVFKVRCALERDQMRLPNGYVGRLKKGMTFQVRFMVNRRSLYQLLYDKIDDWMNPGRIANDGKVAEQ
ncbi:HlyD family efflux transporter periplasmic adaptor subunit [Olivibacter sp. SDN3]|uniref:HlyD family secretion protein n=1 Tax=Olivibacter sp. SDN3 TaxID=2764720 RepID=UPI0016518152|nr:HlyD family efflux transporter periplasmic adaptor subunit [Olivibacter sp. SDN3]QNL48167.1 HlyD family efflux transporter periplasmic adaptor subunit [Olivibacter sp. SDN3]